MPQSTIRGQRTSNLSTRVDLTFPNSDQVTFMYKCSTPGQKNPTPGAKEIAQQAAVNNSFFEAQTRSHDGLTVIIASHSTLGASHKLAEPKNSLRS